MPKKWCPECKEEKDVVTRVFTIRATWNEKEDDYQSSAWDNWSADLYDECIDCGAILEEKEV